MTLHERVLSRAAERPGHPALIEGPSGAVVTYGELAERIARVASVVRGHEVVALWSPNVPAWAGVTLGAMAAGAVVSPIGPAATPHEVASAVRASGATLLVTIPSFAEGARGAGVPVLEIGPELLAAPPAASFASDPAAVALLPFSSGTTGTPKPIELTHANLLAAAEQIQARVRLAPRDRALALAPFAHVMGAMVSLTVPLLAGATVVTLPRFDVDGFLHALSRHRVTFGAVPPPVMRVLAGHPAVDDHDLSALELVACGGAPLHPDVQEAVARRLPHVTIGQGYGMTETSVLITCPDRDRSTRPGTVGHVTDRTEVRVVDGELHVRGPHVMAAGGDGWLRTGDLVEFDADGALRIVGRIKELIKVNGHQVAPAEVEAELMRFPGVEDAGVIGVPDDATGERVVAFVVGDADLDELSAWLAERVASYKRPREWHALPALPRTPAGKLLRRELAAVAV